MKLTAVVFFIACATAWTPFCHAQTPQCSPDTMDIAPQQDFNFGLVLPSFWTVQEIYYRRAEEMMEAPGWCMQQSVGEGWDGSPSLTHSWTNPDGEYKGQGWWAYAGMYWNDAAIWSVTQNWFYLQYKTTYVFTDYETYGVMHWCALEDQKWEIPFERMMVFTASETPDEALLGELRELVASTGFPTQHSVRVNTTNCEYCWGPECFDYPGYDEKEEEEEGNSEEGKGKKRGEYQRGNFVVGRN